MTQYKYVLATLLNLFVYLFFNNFYLPHSCHFVNLDQLMIFNLLHILNFALLLKAILQDLTRDENILFFTCFQHKIM